jgi:hypothetical protein
MKKNQTLLQILKKDAELMHKAALALERSWDDCQSIPKKGTFPMEDMDKLELLSSRFSRLTDFMIQRIFRLIDEIELELPGGTVRDIINRAEKKGLIENADSIIQARILRNRIAHEYVEKVMTEIFEETACLVPFLLDAVKRTDAYIRK